MNILVTGGAGYMGIPLVTELLKKGHRVTILDIFLYGYGSVIHLTESPLLTIKKLDIRNIETKDLHGFDAVYHLAGISGYPACEANPHSAKLINVDATRRLCELLSPGQLLVYASTTSFYGKSGDSCTEETPVEPVSLYGITKYQAEKIVMERENSISLRFATLFGVSPRMRIDLLVNDFTYKAVSERCLVLFESRSKRTFLHVRDAVAAHLLALENGDTMKGGICNVGNDCLNFSKLEIARAVKEATNCTIIDSDMQDFDTRNFVISFKKISALGFKHSRSLADGINEMTRLFDFYRPLNTYRTI